jgi:hypothetical protein
MRCTAALLSRIYVFAAFDGRWPGVTFLILALSGKLALGPIAPGKRGVWGCRKQTETESAPLRRTKYDASQSEGIQGTATMSKVIQSRDEAA